MKTLSADGNTVRVQKIVALPAGEWRTVMEGPDLPGDGPYVVHVLVRNHKCGGRQVSEQYTGVMSWHTWRTNSGFKSSIELHQAGHASNGRRIELRTRRQQGNRPLLLEMRDPDGDVRECTGPQGYDFTFRRLIPPSQIPSAPQVNGAATISDDQLTLRFRKSFALPAGEWRTVMEGPDLPGDGPYVVHVLVRNHKCGGRQVSEQYTGVMSWHTWRTNSGFKSSIELHQAGHASNGRRIELRTRRQPGNRPLLLEMRDPDGDVRECTGPQGYDFTFRRLIPPSQIPSAPQVNGAATISDDQLTLRFRKSFALPAGEWRTVMEGPDLPGDGPYVVHVLVRNHKCGGQQYSEQYTGVMSWHTWRTNSGFKSSIELHQAGHASNGRRIELRTRRQPGNRPLLLEMRDPDKDVRECTGPQGYDFLFRRLIPPSQVPSVPPTTSLLQAYVRDSPGDETVGYGHRCARIESLTIRDVSHTCFFFDCFGTRARSFHGQFVSAMLPSSATSSEHVTEIAAYGVQTTCRFSAITDVEGRYEIALHDSSETASSKRTYVVAAYKEDIFEPKEVTLIDTAQPSRDEIAKVLLVVRKHVHQRPKVTPEQFDKTLALVRMQSKHEVTSADKSTTTVRLSTALYAGEWRTVMKGPDLPGDGPYVVHVLVRNHKCGGQQYSEQYTGVMSWHTWSTNSGFKSSIELHQTGHASNGRRIELRTRRQQGNRPLLLEMRDPDGDVRECAYDFTFRRLIPPSQIPSAPQVNGAATISDDQLTLRFRKSFALPAGEWRTVMEGPDLPGDGPYVVHVLVRNHKCGGRQVSEQYTGVMSWHTWSTNSGFKSSIELHQTGHASNGRRIELRTRRQPGNRPLLLEMRDPDKDVRVCAYDFTFRRLIPPSQIPSAPRVNGAATISDDQLTLRFRKSFALPAGEWRTVMKGPDLPGDGPYVVHVLVRNHKCGGRQYFERYTGVMSWHTWSTNSSSVNSIELHQAGHASNGRRIELRTRRQPDNRPLLLEMRDPDKDVRECTGPQGYGFLFRRLIPPSQVPSVPKMFLSRDEVRRNLDRLTNFTRGEVVLADDVWHELTSYPGDDSITDDAFIAALGSYAVYPLLVYPVIDFGSKTWQNLTVKSSVCANFVLVDHESMAVPVDTHEWHEFYAQLVRAGEDPLAKSAEQCSDPMTPRFMATSADLKGKKFVPVLAPGSADDIRVIHLASAADAVGQGEEDLLERTMVRSSRITLVGSSRDDDVVHSFNASAGAQMKNAATVFRGSSAENEAVASLGAEQDGDQMFAIPPNAEIIAELKDTTTVVIRGAVLFPKSRTQGSTCGLSNARIVLQYDGGQTDTVQTDDAGWFEISVTQRANVKFSADYSNENGVEHDICYASSTLAAATDVNSCEGHKREISVIATEGVFIFFADVTRGTIDLGVYHGVCASRYTGTKFKVTPVNGCHPRALVTHDDIVAWKQVSDESGPEREWPFAAMDYSVSFDEGPSVGGVLDLLAENESKFGNAQCETEPGDMYSYFSSRDALDRLVLMRDGFDNTQRVHYEYHGYLCVEIVGVPKIDDDQETCLKSQSAAGGLLKAHIVGGGANASEFLLDEVRKREFNLRVKTYEVHKDDNALRQCFNLPNGDSGSTTIIVKESMSDPENTDKSCHVSRGGCRFDVTDGGIWDSSHSSSDVCDEGEVIFDASEASEYACERFINISLPNLAFPYRRTIQVDVVRDDTSRSVTASTTRQLVVTGTKARGGGGFSSDVFWATVPLDDMVYTVLHDPPGGLSHSELSSGTELTLTYTLAKTRVASAGGSFDSISTGAKEAKVGASTATGVGVSVTPTSTEAETGLRPFDSELSYHADLPTLSMSVTANEGWDISLTTDRVLRSSQDPMLPGQDGDAIFGGGMELTYTLSDDVDLSRKGEPTDADPVCVNSVPVIVWRPRKLTTYFLVRFDIEALIIPNLKFLMSIAKSGKVQAAPDGWSETKTTYVQALHKHIRDWESVLRQAGAKDVSDNIQHFVGDHIKQHIQDRRSFLRRVQRPYR